MKEGPDIALIGSLVGDPARANMLSALMSGKALTATELANEAGVTIQTGSSHLSKLVTGGLLNLHKQGRHRYYVLAEDVAPVLENIMGLAARRGYFRTRTGPRDQALRQARICYDHLAGDFGILMFNSMRNKGLVREISGQLMLTQEGRAFAETFNLDLCEADIHRRPICLACLDWSARTNHMAGQLGSALLQRFFDLGWVSRHENSRALHFSLEGREKFLDLFDKSHVDENITAKANCVDGYGRGDAEPDFA